jgi:hypothetical protein
LTHAGSSTPAKRSDRCPHMGWTSARWHRRTQRSGGGAAGTYATDTGTGPAVPAMMHVGA